jgi:hypothetical protein
MTLINTTLREILSTGKLGHLYAGMKREVVAELMPELIPPVGKNGWLYRGIEIFYDEDAVSYYKIALKWDNFGFPKHVNVEGYVPTVNTSIDEFVQYLEREKLNYQPLWNSWGADRWLVIFVEATAQAIFGEDTGTLIGIWFHSETEFQRWMQWDIAGNIALNIYDLLSAGTSQGKVLNKLDTYKPVSFKGDSPDVAYLSPETLSKNIVNPVPDLAAILVKPALSVENLQSQVSAYLYLGAKEVWLVYPETKEVHQYLRETPEQSRVYRGEESIDAESFYPKIEGLTTTAIFKLPKWVMKDKT